MSLIAKHNDVRAALKERQDQASENGLRYCSGCKNELDPTLFHASALGGSMRVPASKCCYCSDQKRERYLLPRPERWTDPRTDQQAWLFYTGRSSQRPSQDNIIPSYSYGVPTRGAEAAINSKEPF